MKNQILAAAGLLFTTALAQNEISSGSGFGTYYYDVANANQCYTDLSSANKGQVECSLTQVWTLENVNSDYLVAMNHTQLVGDMGKYCGKRVIVSVNGVPSEMPLFIGDGCERCALGSPSSNVWSPGGAPGLDFSYSVAEKLSSQACDAGHIEITWEIVDELVYQFDYNGSGRSQGFVGSVPTGPSKPTTTTAPPAPTPTNTSSGPCSNNAWQCTPDGTSLEQCINNQWVIRAVCSNGMRCHGTDNPYCNY
ncbi:hypothetical protein TMatcc_006396 [Talaromyces marneffei ATCC 18224]|uniref:Uncharacterized protein n=1 Tax=Talaromyces marneffei (strain ATCC 18224 / CBS 334.59 / QM 7333) TaxID=441960 RepID=B6QB38_TALMQ|nr:uncharacterized protein EYB26_002659 [Talaromyces marneffei]EEA25379.1 hypothetical protein PMAA_064900 [Talaromyces marneffei ATCC 18224]KAE8554106.1 hypothetical protein EYB25_002644 [Talaromyces marneffei]QGA15003.1 hypothetical protein EYB26_002659 [Talaromyces marneffei]